MGPHFKKLAQQPKHANNRMISKGCVACYEEASAVEGDFFPFLCWPFLPTFAGTRVSTEILQVSS